MFDITKISIWQKITEDSWRSSMSLSVTVAPKHRVVGDGTEGNSNGNGVNLNKGNSQGGQGGSGRSSSFTSNSNGGTTGGSGDDGNGERGWEQGSGCNGAQIEKTRKSDNSDEGNETESLPDQGVDIDAQSDLHSSYATGYSDHMPHSSHQPIRSKGLHVYQDMQAQYRARTNALSYWDVSSMSYLSAGDVSTYQGSSDYSSHSSFANAANTQGNRKNAANSTKTVSGSSAGSAPLVVRCGEFTARLLSALIQESSVPPGFLANTISTSSLSVNHNAKDLAESTGDDQGADSKDLANSESGNSQQLTPAQRQQNTLTDIEDKLKRELRVLGLIETNPTNPSAAVNTNTSTSTTTTTTTNGVQIKEEHSDEICQELIKLQRQLQEQVIANKQRRAKYYPLVKEKIEAQRLEKEERDRLFQSEEQALKQLKVLKKKKRTLPPPPTSKAPPAKKARTSTKTISKSHSGMSGRFSSNNSGSGNNLGSSKIQSYEGYADSSKSEAYQGGSSHDYSYSHSQYPLGDSGTTDLENMNYDLGNSNNGIGSGTGFNTDDQSQNQYNTNENDQYNQSNSSSMQNQRVGDLHDPNLAMGEYSQDNYDMYGNSTGDNFSHDQNYLTNSMPGSSVFSSPSQYSNNNTNLNTSNTDNSAALSPSVNIEDNLI